MADKDKILKIKVVTDISGGPEQFKALSEIVKQTDSRLKSLNTTIKQTKDNTEEYTHAIQVEGETLEDLVKAHDEVFKALNKNNKAKNITEGYVENFKKQKEDLKVQNIQQQTALKEGLRDLKENQNKYIQHGKNFSTITLQQTKDKFKEEEIISQKGKESLEFIEFQAAKKIRLINEKLKNDLLEIRKQIESGTLNVGSGRAKSSSLISGASKERLTAIQPVEDFKSTQRVESFQNSNFAKNLIDGLINYTNFVKTSEEEATKEFIQAAKDRYAAHKENLKQQEIDEKLATRNFIQLAKDRLQVHLQNLKQERINEELKIKKQEQEEKEQAKLFIQKAKDRLNIHLKNLKEEIEAEKKAEKENQKIEEEKSKAFIQKAKDRLKIHKQQLEEQKKNDKIALSEYDLIERARLATEKRLAEHKELVRKHDEKQEILSYQRKLEAAKNYNIQLNKIEDEKNRVRIAANRSDAIAAFSIKPGQSSNLPPSNEEFNRVHKGFGDLIKRITEVYLIWGTLNKVSTSFGDFTRSIIPVGIALDSVKATLESTLGSTAAMGSALEFLNKEAERTGINIGTVRESFTSFQASTSLAGVSLQDTVTMFTDLNTVGTALHKTTDDMNHIFLAMSQIFNKSKVQSEELVKQLGNLLPGAFASFAASMKISTKELADRMKAGSIEAQKHMKDFIAFMKDRFAASFATAATMLNADINRMDSAFIKLKESIYSSTSGPIQDFVKSITNLVNYVNDGVNGVNNLGKVLTNVGQISAALAAGSIATVAARFLTVKKEVIGLNGAMRNVTQATLAWEAATGFFGGFAGKLTLVVGLLVEAGLKLKELSDASSQGERDVIAQYKELQKAREDFAKGGQLLVDVNKDPGVIAAKKALTEIEEKRNKIFASLREDRGNISLTGLEKDTIELFNKSHGTNYTGSDQVKPETIKQIYSWLVAIQQQQVKMEEERARSQAQTSLADERRRIEEGRIAISDIVAPVEDSIAKYNKDYEKQSMEQMKGTFDKTIKQLNDEIAYSKLQKELKVQNELEDETKARIERENKRISDAEEQIERIKIASANGVADFVAKKREEEQNNRIADAKEFYRIEDEKSTTLKKQEETNIEELTGKYKQGLISIRDFYTQLNDIKSKNLLDQLNIVGGKYNKAIDIGDTESIGKFQEDMNQLSESGKKIPIESDNNYEQDLKKYQQALANISAEYEKYTNNVIEFYDAKYDKLHAEDLKLINAQLKDSNKEVREQAEAAKALYEINKENYKLEEESRKFDRQRSKITQDYSQQVDYLNTLKETGNLSDFNYTIKLTEANKIQIQQLEKTIELEKEKLAEAKSKDIPIADAITDKIGLLENELTRLRLTSNATALEIQNVLTSSFTNSFDSFVTGAASAKDAARGLFTDILHYVAKIAEQEAANAIVKMLFAGVSAAVGGSGAYGSATNNSFFASGANLPYAKGGVFDKGNVVPFANGGIINSPIMFPLNKGTGLAGEAGPEAIVPLKRTRKGELGIASSEGGNSNVYNVSITVEKGSKNETSEQFGNRAAEAFIRRISNEEIQKANRPGGQNNTYRRFG